MLGGFWRDGFGGLDGSLDVVGMVGMVAMGAFVHDGFAHYWCY